MSDVECSDSSRPQFNRLRALAATKMKNSVYYRKQLLQGTASLLFL